MQNSDAGGGGGFGGGYQEIMIPGSMVGLVIGRGGETIKQLQERSGAKMVIIQDGPGQELEKPLRISGEAQNVEHAKKLVYELIQERESYSANNRQGGAGGQPQQQYNNGGGEQAEIFVPKIAVGVVIGKRGDMIKRIQEETGCKLQLIQGRNEAPGDRRCVVQGSKSQIHEGIRMIEELIQNLSQREEQYGNRGSQGHYQSNEYAAAQPAEHYNSGQAYASTDYGVGPPTEQYNANWA